MDHVISELCYKGSANNLILICNITVEFNGLKFGSHNMTIISKMLIEVCDKGSDFI